MPFSGNFNRKIIGYYNHYLLAAIIGITILITIYFNYYMGIDVYYTHFYYIPIILTGIWYYRKAIYLAIGLGMIHIILGYVVTGAIVESTLFRAAMFIIVSLIVASLSESREKLYISVRDSENELNTILNSVYDAIIIHDVDGIIVDVNDRMLEIYGVKREQVRGTSVTESLSGFDNHPERLPDMWKHALQGQDQLFEWTARRPGDGSTFDVEVFLRRIDLKSKPYIMATVRDITQRKTEEEERLKLARYISLLLESTDQGIFAIDKDGRCTIINRSACSALGYQPAEIIGNHIHELIHYRTKEGEPCHRSECCAYQSLISGKGCMVYDDIFWKKDGTSFPIEYSSFPILEDSEIKGSVITFRDITERKESMEKIKDARMQAELYLDLMGHDINNMNQIGIAYLEEALDVLKIPQEDMILIKKPLEAMYNSSRLIKDVRMLQVIKEGTTGLKKVETGRILDEVIEEYSHVPDRKIDIRRNRVTNYTVMANDLLKEVFSNIIGNAVKHSEGPLIIDINTEVYNEDKCVYCKVVISDNGPGIPDDVKEKLFVRFQRGPTRAAGKGLGLFIVKSLVESYHGRVWVEDRISGDHTQGTSFVMLLPFANADQCESATGDRDRTTSLPGN